MQAWKTKFSWLLVREVHFCCSYVLPVALMTSMLCSGVTQRLALADYYLSFHLFGVICCVVYMTWLLVIATLPSAISTTIIPKKNKNSATGYLWSRVLCYAVWLEMPTKWTCFVNSADELLLIYCRHTMLDRSRMVIVTMSLPWHHKLLQCTLGLCLSYFRA